MKLLRAIGYSILLLLPAAPALAQLSTGGGTGGGMQGGMQGGSPMQPQTRTPDIAPVGIPGAGSSPVATGPVMQKPTIGDPTQALFTAVNSGDYNAAQDAISRGANLSAQDPLGETPLDLAVSLNRTNITFLILESRNEDGGNTQPISPGPAFPNPPTPQPTQHPIHYTPATTPTAPTYGTNPGTPVPDAGFLGFGSK